MSGGGGESHTDELWLVPYSDLMTILALFFLSLYGLAQAKKNTLSSAQSLMFIQKEMSGNREEIQKLEIKAHEASVAQSIEGMLDNLKKDDVAFSVDSKRFRVTLSAGVLFTSGYAELQPDAAKLLKGIADSLKVLPNPIVVEGHTDDQQMGPHSQFVTNWDLSVARAFAVIRLFNEEGIPASRLSALGYAQFQPVAPNTTPEGRARNRRIEISLLRSDDADQPSKPAEGAPSAGAPASNPAAPGPAASSGPGPMPQSAYPSDDSERPSTPQ
jgi:chemotaxis protein MotB